MVQKHSCQSLPFNQAAFLNSFAATKNILLATNLLDPRESERSQSLNNQRKVTQKMRNKLISWLEKLSLSVFGFQKKTLVTAIIILDQYLSLKDQDPSSLQMLGCASLLIASKLRQSTIVAVECYVAASCRIFTKNQLLEKQRFLYSIISWKKIAQGPQRVINRACILLDIESKQQHAINALNIAISKKSCHLFKIFDLVSFCLSLSYLELQADQKLLSLAL